jgi:hypothetical protein
MFVKTLSFLFYRRPLCMVFFSMMMILAIGTGLPHVDSADVNVSIGKIKSMTMPGENMTFGSSLDNALIHLDQAIMNLNDGNIKGAMMQLNMTGESISLHEKEMMEMMKSMQLNVSDAER